jgi:hypothetical protein
MHGIPKKLLIFAVENYLIVLHCKPPKYTWLPYCYFCFSKILQSGCFLTD